MAVPMITRSPYPKGVAFFDFDGCISICNWREAVLPINKLEENYNKFHKLAKYDPPNILIIDLMRKMKAEGVVIVVLTGRMENNRTSSHEWLDAHDVPSDWMEMRKNNDYRPSEIIKAEYLSEFFMEEVIMVFDDRKKIIDHLRELGYPTFHVANKL